MQNFDFFFKLKGSHMFAIFLHKTVESISLSLNCIFDSQTMILCNLKAGQFDHFFSLRSKERRCEIYISLRYGRFALCDRGGFKCKVNEPLSLIIMKTCIVFLVVLYFYQVETKYLSYSMLDAVQNWRSLNKNARVFAAICNSTTWSIPTYSKFYYRFTFISWSFFFQ